MNITLPVINRLYTRTPSLLSDVHLLPLLSHSSLSSVLSLTVFYLSLPLLNCVHKHVFLSISYYLVRTQLQLLYNHIVFYYVNLRSSIKAFFPFIFILFYMYVVCTVLGVFYRFHAKLLYLLIINFGMTVCL
jgi:hypothetical protein